MSYMICGFIMQQDAINYYIQNNNQANLQLSRNNIANAIQRHVVFYV